VISFAEILVSNIACYGVTLALEAFEWVKTLAFPILAEPE